MKHNLTLYLLKSCPSCVSVLRSLGQKGPHLTTIWAHGRSRFHTKQLPPVLNWSWNDHWSLTFNFPAKCPRNAGFRRCFGAYSVTERVHWQTRSYHFFLLHLRRRRSAAARGSIALVAAKTPCRFSSDSEIPPITASSLPSATWSFLTTPLHSHRSHLIAAGHNIWSLHIPMCTPELHNLHTLCAKKTLQKTIFYFGISSAFD